MQFRVETARTFLIGARIHVDAFVGDDPAKAHPVSVIGGDNEIGAMAAAFANGDPFTLIEPSGKEAIVSLGEKPMCFRGSITVGGESCHYAIS